MKTKYKDRPELSVGDIVMATAGRDGGKYFLVVEAMGEYVRIADGRLRKMSKPKLKKNMHLAKLGRAQSIEFLDSPGGTADAEIRKILKEV